MGLAGAGYRLAASCGLVSHRWTKASQVLETIDAQKAVQHLAGGLIKEGFRREGDQVKGQLLFAWDGPWPNNLETIRQRYIGRTGYRGAAANGQQGLQKSPFIPMWS
jgi:protease secretion system membrane fusion protein